MKNQIVWKWYLFEDLNYQELHDMYALRQDVFIIEQECLYKDIDGKDGEAYHLLGWYENKLVATLRLFESYQPYLNNASIGRVCTDSSVRKHGIGKVLVEKAIEFVEENFLRKSIQIGAQYYLKNFYQTFGFEQISEIYDEDGIDHIFMIKEFKN